MADATMTTNDTTPRLTRRGVIMAAALAATTLAAGCGKRGPLEPAEGTNADKAKAAPADSTDGVIPSMKGARRRPPPIQPPKQDFFLDFLL